MKRIFLFSLMSLVSSFAYSQEVQYDISGTYSDTTKTTAYTAAGDTFDFRFIVPASVANSTGPHDTFNLDASVLSASYTFNGLTLTADSGSYGFHAHDLNDSSLALTGSAGAFGFYAQTPGGGNVLPSLAGRPDASGMSSFATGDFGVKDLSGLYFTGANGIFYTGEQSANVTGTSVMQPVPEPSTWAMMVVGGLSLAGVQAFRRRRVTA